MQDGQAGAPINELGDPFGRVIEGGRRIFLIGRGEVGQRLAAALESSGWSVRTVLRDSGWEAAADASDPSPRIVAVREEDLAGVLARLSSELRPTLVLVQNGFLEAVHGPLGPVSRGLIYFTSKADFFKILCPSPFGGPLADTVGSSIGEGGIPTEVLEDDATFTRAMIVKGIWNCVVGLPLAAHGVDLATYLRDQRAELDSLTEESALAAAAEYGVSVSGEEAVEKILETTMELGWVRGGAKALAWRNGAIAAFGRRHGVPTPINDRLLRAVGFDLEL